MDRIAATTREAEKLQRQAIASVEKVLEADANLRASELQRRADQGVLLRTAQGLAGEALGYVGTKALFMIQNDEIVDGFLNIFR